MAEPDWYFCPVSYRIRRPEFWEGSDIICSCGTKMIRLSNYQPIGETMSADGLNEYLDDELPPKGTIEFDNYEPGESPVKSKVYIPPRRRSATLEVKLSDNRTAKITVAKTNVKFSLTHHTGYAVSNGAQLTRDIQDMELLVKLFESAIEELYVQTQQESDDATAGTLDLK